MFNEQIRRNIFEKEKLSLVAFGAVFFILLLLGLWQAIRHNEKTDYINNIVENMKLDAMELDANQDSVLFSKVKLKGEIDFLNYFWLYRRHPLAKNIDGAYLVVPIMTSQKKFLTILGWFSNDNKDNILNEIASNPKISLEGILLGSEKISNLVPSNDFTKRILFTLNIEQISSELGINLGNYFIAAIDVANGFDTNIIPITPGMMVNIKNDHLGYSATWFGLAIALCYIYYIYLKRNYSKEDDS